MDNPFSTRFEGASAQELVDALNREAGNCGWVGARGAYLKALREALLRSGLDVSLVADGFSLKLIRVKIESGRLVPLDPTSQPAPSAPGNDRKGPNPFADLDEQQLIDAVVKAEAAGDHDSVELAAEVMAERDYPWDMNDSGILCRFEHVESIEFIEKTLAPSPRRLAKLEGGDELTVAERRRIVEAVTDDELFQADGDADMWAIYRLESTFGRVGYLAVTVSGGGFAGVEWTVQGLFNSSDDAKAGLQQLGYLDAGDFRNRYPL